MTSCGKKCCKCCNKCCLTWNKWVTIYGILISIFELILSVVINMHILGFCISILGTIFSGLYLFFILKEKEKEIFLNGELQLQKKTHGYGEMGRMMKKTCLCLKGLAVET